MGQWVAGDEKLFHFTGRSGILRLVPKKPDQIGIWNYELTARLTNGQSYLLYFRSHSQNAKLGDGIPVNEIVQDWATIIENKTTEGKTLLVADCYYLDEKGRKILNEKTVPYLCGVQSNRFSILSEQASAIVRKAGDYTLLYNEERHELFVHYWFPDMNLGKKYTLSNAYTPLPGTTAKQYIPAIDDFAAMFATCDHFNREMHDRTWPHHRIHCAHQMHNFYMTCILLNVMHAHTNHYQYEKEGIEWEAFMVQLADEVYEYASNCSD